MLPGKLTVEGMVEGDTWRGVPSLTVTIDGLVPSVALAGVKMQFRKRIGGVVGDELSTANGRISILSAANWQVRIGPSMLELTQGSWLFDCEFTAVDGSVYTMLKGTLQVAAGITE